MWTTRLIVFVVVILIVVAIVACGGGGSNNNKNNTNDRDVLVTIVKFNQELDYDLTATFGADQLHIQQTAVADQDEK